MLYLFIYFYLQQGHRLDSLNDTFWLMTFFESVCLIASQMFANWHVGNHMERNTALPSSTAMFLATVCFAFITRGWAEIPRTTSFKEYSMSLYAYIFGGKTNILFCLPFVLLYKKLYITHNVWFHNCLSIMSLGKNLEHF